MTRYQSDMLRQSASFGDRYAFAHIIANVKIVSLSVTSGTICASLSTGLIDIFGCCIACDTMTNGVCSLLVAGDDWSALKVSIATSSSCGSASVSSRDNEANSLSTSLTLRHIITWSFSAAYSSMTSSKVAAVLPANTSYCSCISSSFYRACSYEPSWAWISAVAHTACSRTRANDQNLNILADRFTPSAESFLASLSHVTCRRK